MQPLSKSAAASYASPDGLRFTKAIAAKIQAVIGTSAPTLPAWLDGWLRVVKARRCKSAQCKYHVPLISIY